MERRQSRLLLSRERLTTALSHRPERQDLLTILHRIERPFSHWGMLQSRNQEMERHAPTNLRQIIGLSPIVWSPVGPNRIVHRRQIQIFAQSPIVRRQPNRIIGLSLIVRNPVGPNRIVHPRQNLTFAQSPIVRRQYNRTIGLSRIGMSLSGRKLLRRTSVLSPNTLLLLRKRGLHRNNRHSLLQ